MFRSHIRVLKCVESWIGESFSKVVVVAVIVTVIMIIVIVITIIITIIIIVVRLELRRVAIVLCKV